MSDHPSVYYLSQALELRDTPSEVEKSLRIETRDRNWLRNLFLANQDARQAVDPPMSVEKLTIVASGGSVADLAGTFLVSGHPRHPIFLYTPAFGLERFDTREQVIKKLLERLNIPSQRNELLRFVALRIKAGIRYVPPPTLLAEPITGDVLDDRRQSIEHGLDHNRASLHDELLKLPSLKALINLLFKHELGTRLNQVNLNALSVIGYAAPTQDPQGNPLPRQRISTHDLSDALLDHHARGGWAEGRSREFIAPGYTASAEDKATLEHAITSLSGQLNSRLSTAIRAFWNETIDQGQSRREFFIEALGTRYRAEVLQQELDWNSIAPEVFHWLCGLYPLDISRLHQVTPYFLAVNTMHRSSLLTNAFAVRNDRDHYPGFFLYCAGRLRTFESETALLTWLNSQLQDRHQPDDVRHGLSLRECVALKATSLRDITLVPGSLSVFERLFDALVDKQVDNVAFVLERYRASNGALALAAAFDSALDVRALLDPRMLSLNYQGRWSQRLDLSTAEQATAPGLPLTLNPTLDTVRYQLRTLKDLQSTIAQGLKKRPTLKAFVQSELSRELRLAHSASPSAADLYINNYGSPLPAFGDTQQLPNRSQSLVEHFLERLTNRQEALIPASNIGLFSKTVAGNWSRVASPDIAALNMIVEKTLPDFLGHYLRRQRSVYGELSVPLDEAVTSGLRREAQLKALRGALTPADLAVLDNVLDSHRRDLRKGLRGFIPDAFALTLRTDASATPIKLHNCFLLTERGGLSAEHSGIALLWTPVQGTESFASFHAARIELQRRLHDPVERLSLLENIARNDLPVPLEPHPDNRINHRAYPALDFELIHNGLPGNRLHSLIDKALGDLAHATVSAYSGDNLHQHLQSCLDTHSTLPILEKAIEAAENSAMHLALPGWLSGSTHSRQFALAALFDRYGQTATADDYQRDIPSIRDNARAKVTSLLSRDFPTVRVDPDNISISVTLRNAATATLESLTDYALRHFDDINQGSIVVRALAGTLPEELTTDRLKTLVKEAAVGGHFAKILDAFLSNGKNGITWRRSAFGEHCFWQSLLHAFSQVIRNTLSSAAHGFIKHVLAMPDGLAREPLNGQNIDIRPLELISAAHASTDPVAGLYMIGPPPGAPGPRVLFTPHGTLPIFKEYADEAAFVADLKVSGELQQQVLERLAHDQRAHYARHVFAAQRAIMGISDNPVRGNLLHRLYQDTTALLKDLLGRQHVQDQGSAWSTVLSWLKSGLEQGETRLLGRLRMPQLIWQTLPQLKDAADKAWQGQWADAIEAFVVSLAQLASARAGWSRPGIIGGTETQTVIESPFPEPPWGASQLTPGQKARILGHEARDVSLQDMTLDRDTHLYHDATTQSSYAVVGGKVFRVRQEPQRWRIVKDNARGPWLRLNEHKQWSLDLEGHCIEEPSQ